uniref:Putative secreted protein n=1 Tax=Anopheles darlingi TaxID=43151 RepID=A0A2M4D8K1_ANODA
MLPRFSRVRPSCSAISSTSIPLLLEVLLPQASAQAFRSPPTTTRGCPRARVIITVKKRWKSAIAIRGWA